MRRSLSTSSRLPSLIFREGTQGRFNFTNGYKNDSTLLHYFRLNVTSSTRIRTTILSRTAFSTTRTQRAGTDITPITSTTTKSDKGEDKVSAIDWKVPNGYNSGVSVLNSLTGTTSPLILSRPDRTLTWYV